jgi:uncharacterized membrane protein
MIFSHPQYVNYSIFIAAAAILVFIVARLYLKTPVRLALMRLLAVLLLALALPGPHFEWSQPSSEAIVVTDVSDSFSEPLAESALSRVRAYDGDDLKLSYLPFAAKPAPFKDTSHSDYGGMKRAWSSLNVGETNLEGAIYKAIQTGTKNIILVSDGWETRGSAEQLLPTLKQRGIKIFPVVDERGARSQTLLELTRLTAPMVAPAEKSVDIRATIRNDYESPQNGLLELVHGGKVVQKKIVKLDPGQESVIVGKSDPSKEGIQEVKAIFTPVDPQLPASVKSIFISGERREKILMLSGTEEDARYLEDILNAQKFRIESRVAPNTLHDLPKLEEFSVVLLNNVGISQVPPSFARDFESFVKNGGGGAMIGGNRSFGLGGFIGTAIERALPVDMVPPQAQQKRLNVAVSLVLDKSRSMSADNKIFYVKEAAGAVIRNLKDDDFIEVIGFDSSPFIVIKMGQLAEIRSSAMDRVSRLFPAGRTNLLPAMYESKRSLTKVDAGRKHMIILTDGKVPNAGPYYSELIKQMRGDGITVSTVMLGSETDTKQLEDMAQEGGGAFHQTTNAASLAKIFIDDIRVSTGERTLKENFEYNVRRAPVENKITDISAFPPLRGYVQTKPKSKANVELLVTQADKADPLLAFWTYGAGRALAFTSDANGRWSSFWASWERFYSFWSDVVESLRPKSGGGAEAIKFDLRYKVDKGILKLDLSIFTPDTVGALVATLKKPQGDEIEVSFYQDSPGRYLAEVPDIIAGQYEFRSFIGKKPLTPISFILPGDLFGEKQGRGTNMQLLEQLAVQTGGVVNPSKQEILVKAEPKRIKFKLSSLIIALASMLLLLEIIMRESGFVFRRRARSG